MNNKEPELIILRDGFEIDKRYYNSAPTEVAQSAPQATSTIQEESRQQILICAELYW